ncbi:MAG: hypothetical protein HFG77_04480 [Hungatella sp.]|jgi:hypothetical protein|nr:hypothetical protein [Hungatella sp.]
MNQYSPIEGVVTSIAPLQSGSRPGCVLLLYVQTDYQETFQILVDTSTYVLDQKPVRRGDPVIVFYDITAPVPLIYPPQYKAVAMLVRACNEFAMLDYFDQNLRNSENTLILNPSGSTTVQLPNGQYYQGTLGNQYMLVLYTTNTRSIPAQTTPVRIIVFCCDT